mgnify:CR=1 FL=1
MFTLLQLKYFCTACELGNVTKAAEKLFVTQPTVTAAIRELEKEYGIQLLERKGKTLSLTPEGNIFYQNARLLLYHAQELDRQMQDLAQQKRYVRLGVTKSVGSNIYTEYFPHGILEHPQIDMVTHSGSSSELLAELREHQLDVILVPSQSMDTMEDLERAQLKNTDMLYCMSKDHPLAAKEVLKVGDIVGERMVSTCKDENKVAALNRLLLAQGYDNGPIVIQRFEQLNTALSMIRMNIGTGYFPEEGIRGYEGVVGKKIEGDPSIHVYVVWTKTSWRKEEVRIFVKNIRKFYEKSKKADK